jgi:DNA modification methylase
MSNIQLSDLHLNPDNPRYITEERFEKLKASLTAMPHGLEANPIKIDKAGVIQAGNMRYRALIALGYSEIPKEWVFTIPESWPPEDVERFLLVDNVQFGDWDKEGLANRWSLDYLQGVGLQIKLPDEVETPEDNDPEIQVPDEAITQLGDLIQIGRHFLLCGDATNKRDADRLIAASPRMPDLMVTDPPYGVEYDPEWRSRAGLNSRGTAREGKVDNDHLHDWRLAYQHFPGSVAYVWHGGKFTSQVQQSLEACDFEIVAQIIWAKDHYAISRGDYHWQHEPCWYAARGNHNWQGSRKMSTIWKGMTTLWEIPRPKRNDGGHHSTQKPVECMARPIRNNTQEGWAVYDPFLGSGTTLVAAHQTDRIGLGIELNPIYCDIIVQRMTALTGEPVLVNGKQTDRYETAAQAAHE